MVLEGSHVWNWGSRGKVLKLQLGCTNSQCLNKPLEAGFQRSIRISGCRFISFGGSGGSVCPSRVGVELVLKGERMAK
jgi:hypothetical protein